jgi:hypothetical protein
MHARHLRIYFILEILYRQDDDLIDLVARLLFDLRNTNIDFVDSVTTLEYLFERVNVSLMQPLAMVALLRYTFNIRNITDDIFAKKHKELARRVDIELEKRGLDPKRLLQGLL